MGDHANQDDLAAAMQLMLQQMQQLQQTIQAQEQAAQQQQQEQQAQTNEKSDCSKKGNSSDTQKIDELTAKVDQLLKNNQWDIFSMDQATAGHIQNQNHRQPQSNRQAVPATENSQPDELKGLRMMMQQLLQGQQVQAKVLNQVTTEMDTRMGNMFTELNAKCMTSRHTRRNAQGELVTLTNQELARLERTNRQQPRETDTTMGDHANQDDLAAEMQLMQQQIQ
ncbi:hypothetical protein F2Q69_00004458 [Brassica cretica]|uniref:Uncharacterized protein n=1 Tax=Brassica cretica TaxID=69181 RepID=A0A8S9NVV2_BRACR|nr:hypothetical protein F2Q69_00004458 [Brassica cretica]